MRKTLFLLVIAIASFQGYVVASDSKIDYKCDLQTGSYTEKGVLKGNEICIEVIISKLKKYDGHFKTEARVLVARAFDVKSQFVINTLLKHGYTAKEIDNILMMVGYEPDLDDYKIIYTRLITLKGLNIPEEIKKPLIELMTKTYEDRRSGAYSERKFASVLSNDIWIIVNTSSYIDLDSNRYIAKNMFDKNINTAWCTNNKKSGIGENITFKIRDYDLKCKNKKGYQVSKGVNDTQEVCYIEGLSVHVTNGYQKSKSTMLNNARPSRIRINIIPYNSSYFMELSETQGEIFIPIYKTVDEITAKEILITLLIEDVYPGEKYKDMCISEISLDLKTSLRER